MLHFHNHDAQAYIITKENKYYLEFGCSSGSDCQFKYAVRKRKTGYKRLSSGAQLETTDGALHSYGCPHFNTQTTITADGLKSRMEWVAKNVEPTKKPAEINISPSCIKNQKMHERIAIMKAKPEAWRYEQIEIFRGIQRFRLLMRDKHNLIADRDIWKDALPPKSRKDYQFQCFLLLFLSGGIKDAMVCRFCKQMVCRFCKQLFSTYQVDAQWFVQTPLHELKKILTPLSKNNINAERLQIICKSWIKEHNGKPPLSFDVMVSYKGISHKTTILTLWECYGIVAGIGTDRHLARIFKVLGWCCKNTSSAPEDSRVQVEAWLDRSWWPHLNDALAGLSQLLADFDASKIIMQEAKELLPPKLLKTIRTINSLYPRKLKNKK